MGSGGLRSVRRRLLAGFTPVIAIALAGCIAGGGQQGPTATQRLDATIGKNERDIISRWGTPDAFFEFADGGRSLTWEHSYWVESWQEQWRCEIVLETDSAGTIVDWSYSFDYDAANPCHDIMDGLA